MWKKRIGNFIGLVYKNVGLDFKNGERMEDMEEKMIKIMSNKGRRRI